MNLRIPMWAQGKPVPGDLYSYVDSSAQEITVSVNGEKVAYDVVDGYACIERKWNDGDVVEINLPMPVREIVASDKVEADRGLVAIERGPIVYCFEEVDNGKVIKAAGHDSLEDAKKAEILISKTAEFAPSYEAGLLGGVVTLSDGTLKAVPYCVWDNRGDGQMSVWLKK
ncbi:MAG: glycoside hydrolase family 127 protein [Bacteroidales bacterium]|nr:glycoside hydrolase family 127 protein [Candidatus Cryptobacteroides caccocaballi]